MIFNIKLGVVKMSSFKENLYTIKEINQVSTKEKLSKAFQSYASIYNLVKKGRVPYTKAGNRYLLRICDIEKALLSDYSISSDGVRKIS